MDSKDIRELIELISRSNFKSFELEREGFRLKLIKQDGVGVVSGPAEQAGSGAPREIAPGAAAALPAEDGSGVSAADGLHDLHSPIVGTFYAAPSPGAPNFVEVGSSVSKGQVLCIVEAMKVMNEIRAEKRGTIKKVLGDDAHPVEYMQPIFEIEPD